ncbi:DNA-binding protein [Bacterioplanes sanyensis]|uniref:DNA-binding protein n=1 Tax=Bacterioplanes sanyensis TaxID=1249553 RepID=A0A222FPB4_9GAMM|nr:helix-turn-helix domain-containing protein [Bacterioplanes sanyensis]ASP40354.1 DNA-binding protein [Bacterioplanes sanyensis]
MNQKLMSVSEWRDQRFIGKPPAYSTVKRWIKNGELPAKQLGGTWYVIVSEEQNTTGDALVDAVLRAQ